mmetsp:Transcript_7126/g.14007  ORF Transcript_7126/g.14007 Transcript_7126/m.14007 type:complete len:121 (-) Transcript_7126:138-500(-)
MDWDMAILGQPWERYRRYMAEVRQEFKHIPEFIWCAARPGFLSKTLEEKAIFSTSQYHKKLESKARENIAREIKILDGQVTTTSKLMAHAIIFLNANSKKLLLGGLAAGVGLCLFLTCRR